MLLEAMLAGLPVVATRVSAIPEIVVDGETGLLAPAGDAHAIAGDALGAARRSGAPRAHSASTACGVRTEEFSVARMTERTHARLRARRVA